MRERITCVDFGLLDFIYIYIYIYISHVIDVIVFVIYCYEKTRRKT